MPKGQDLWSEVRTATSKALIVNESINNKGLNVLCLTETWIRPNEYAINKVSPPGHSDAHLPCLIGEGGCITIIYF